jgi:hypothetical protein
MFGLPEVNIDMSRIVDLCDPRRGFDSDEEFAVFWGDIRKELERHEHLAVDVPN